MINKIASILCFLLISNTLSAQHQWVEGMYNANINFYETQKSFEEYWEGKEITKGKGWKQFKRWEAFMESRVYPDGVFHDNIMAISEQARMQARSNNNPSSWEAVGPTNVPLTNWGGKRGVGRINAIAFHPTNENIFWVGTPAGGLWKTTDSGQSWSNNTDQLPSLGVSAITIDPNDTQIMYIALGDRDGGDTYSYGILKSTNGGESWNTTGLSFNYSSGYIGYQILINPNNSNIINVSIKKAGSGEVYRSIDGGENWEITLSGQKLISMQQHPTNPDIIYGGTSSSGKIYKSTDNGQSWNVILPSQGMPNGGSRVTLAVSPSSPNMVYALIANNEGGFFGFFRSEDSGDSWTLQSNSPNILNWSSSGEGDNDGQGWYDLALTVSPTNENEIYTGGVNTWKSTDGGINWSIDSHWYGSNGVPYKHADEHVLQFHPNGTLYSGNDGGLYRKEGDAWTDISDGLQITQFYSIGISQNNPELVIAGAQDNGTLLMNGDEEWSAVLGGDGMECLIDYTDDNIMYAEYYYGDLHKSTDGGASFSWIAPNGQEGAWETPYIIDPNDHNTLYIGYDEVWKTTEGGYNWIAISNNLTNGDNIDELAIAPSNSNVLYAASNSKIYRTINGGIDWTNISNQLPNRTISYISVHPNNPNKVWVSLSGFSSNKKVYVTNDGGDTWENISYNLPNLPANCIIHDNSSINEKLFLATDIGVYFKDSTMNEWTPFNQGLPNVIVKELEIQYPSNTLFASTYGRGVWKSSLVPQEPIASFTTSSTTVCVENCLNFQNTSLNYATNFEWSFEGGIPTNSTSINPENICYPDTGAFDVSLIVHNNSGTDTILLTDYIEVTTSSESNTSLITCDSYLWNGTTYTENGTYIYHGLNEYGCDSTATLELSFIPNTVESSPFYINTNEETQFQITAYGGTPPYTYQWNTGETTTNISPTLNGSYWVVVNDNNLCTDTSYFEIYSFPTGIEEAENNSFTLFPNPANGLLTISLNANNNEAYNIKLLAINGAVVLDLKSPLNNEQKQLQIDVSKLPKGPYFVQLQTNIGMVYKKLIIQ